MKNILLTNSARVAHVDDEDYERVQARRWYLHSGGYVAATDHNDERYLHRFILRCEEVDHIDNNKLNNVKSNLRISTSSLNNHNKDGRGASKYKGVTKSNRTKPWKARIVKDGKEISLGNYETEEEAARAYDLAAIELWGLNANTNFAG